MGLSIERWLKVCHPVDYGLNCSRTSYIIVFLSFSLSLFLSFSLSLFLNSFFYYFSGMISLFTLMGLSIERWLMVCHPVDYVLNCSRTSYIIVGSAWALGLLTSAPPLFGWAYYAPETSGMR
jgi:hypothetical protein